MKTKSYYLSEKNIDKIKKLSAQSIPHCSQSAIVNDAIEKYDKGEINGDSEKTGSKETSNSTKKK
jgi:hypothetical protein